MPNLWIIVRKPGGFIALSRGGEVRENADAVTLAAGLYPDPIASVNRRIEGVPEAMDVLEPFALANPASNAVPTVAGLADFYGLDRPVNGLEKARAAMSVCEKLLAEMPADAMPFAAYMGNRGWAWGPFLPLAGVKEADNPIAKLETWEESSPRPPAGNAEISDTVVAGRLEAMLATKKRREHRREQLDYALAVTKALKLPVADDESNLVLAEAGTGIGKTLGYLAPISAWLEANQGQVWLSTFTKTLQNQLLEETRSIPGKPKVAVLKGRGNYVCLLDFDDLWNSAGAAYPLRVVAAGLVGRWLTATAGGDIVSGDWPGWLNDLLGAANVKALTDQAGECIYTACPHFRRCFIEKAVHKARAADIVILNHTLAMLQAAGDMEAPLAPVIVFDEGHLLFRAADGVFAAGLSGLDGQQLRRWILGPESGRNFFRARGLRRRLEDLAAFDDGVKARLDDLVHLAGNLPSSGWLKRVRAGGASGSFELFLQAVHSQVRALNSNLSPYTEECDTMGVTPEVGESAGALMRDMKKFLAACTALEEAIRSVVDDPEKAENIGGTTAAKADSALKSIGGKIKPLAQVWIDMLFTIGISVPAGFIDTLAVERDQGQDLNVGFFRHFSDPMAPFSAGFNGRTRGIVITSATLTDRTGDEAADWKAAAYMTGARHFAEATAAVKLASPFDYGRLTKVLIVTDVDKGDSSRLAAAMSALFTASQGGAIGLFTAIERLRAVHGKIRDSLAREGLNLYAQHVDEASLSTLLDIFKAEENSCLLGTDALRDGIDVPGASLRLVVFDRVPWNKPDLVHKARRKDFGDPELYDKMMLRTKMTQAFGRLVRRADDKGVFAILDRGVPTLSLSAFPPGTEIVRTTLSDACRIVRDFL